MNTIMHKSYLPFTEEQLLLHFADVKIQGKCVKNPEHLAYFRKSIDAYKKFIEKNPDRLGKSLDNMRKPCQIEKDERFWTASCLMTIYYSRNRKHELIKLLKKTYGERPLIKDLYSWDEYISDNIQLLLEPNLPSPKSYKQWLQDNITERQLIPYILDSVHKKRTLEGPTNVDALLLNPDNGFAVVAEAKVLSDISYHVTYDEMRNQIARNIDVMLEKNHDLCHPLNKRDPGKTLFLLITPKIFKDNPTTRLYGFKFNEYKNSPESLASDLPHRKGYDWGNISKRLGWLTWEDFKSVNSDCCGWLK